VVPLLDKIINFQHCATHDLHHIESTDQHVKSGDVGEELEYRIMCRTTCTENSSVALEVKIELSRVTNVAVYQCLLDNFRCDPHLYHLWETDCIYLNQSQEK
jgi:hypothetical protein